MSLLSSIDHTSLSFRASQSALMSKEPSTPKILKSLPRQKPRPSIKNRKAKIQMPKCFTLPRDAVKLTKAPEPLPHWYWKTKSHGEYYGSPVNVKQIPKPINDDKQVQTFQSIAALLTDLHHPNIVQYLGVVAASHYTEWSVVTERLDRGELATLLKSSTSLTKAQCVQILLDVACGMSYLHGQSPPMLHRDLRAANIHITADFRAKITNFELAGQLGLNKALVGTPAWVAPEIMRRDTNYTEKIDIYSFAMLMVEIMNRHTPYADETLPKAELLRRVTDEGKRPNVKNIEDWPRPLVDLMVSCWSNDPSERPSFTTIANQLQDIHKNITLT